MPRYRFKMWGHKGLKVLTKPYGSKCSMIWCSGSLVIVTEYRFWGRSPQLQNHWVLGSLEKGLQGLEFQLLICVAPWSATVCSLLFFVLGVWVPVVLQIRGLGV